MGCVNSSSAAEREAAENYGQVKRVPSQRINRLASRLDSSKVGRINRRRQEKGKMRNQLVREIFDEDIHDFYDFTGPHLGEGGFGTVSIITSRTTKATYAMKEINLEELQGNSAAMRMLENEMELMKELSHPNIVRLQEIYQPIDGKTLYLVMDKLEGGTVHAKWVEQEFFSEAYTAKIIKQVCSAIRFCHHRNIIHRDLKLDNLLFESKDSDIVKIIDFGLSTRIGKKMVKEFVGTVFYTAPEILKVEPHSYPADMWSIGIITYTCICGTFPFYDPDADVAGSRIKYSNYTFDHERFNDVSPLCKDFISLCLQKNPKKRMDAFTAQAHPWLATATRVEGESLTVTLETLEALERFQRKTAFKKIAMMVVAHSLPPEHLSQLEREFALVDTDGDGSISMEEFRRVILGSNAFHSGFSKSNGGAKMSVEDVDKMFASIDLHNSGEINFNEFVAACLDKRILNEQTVKTAFDRLDYGRHGTIKAEDLKMYVGEEMTTAEVQAAIDEITSEGQNNVGYEDFRNVMLRSMSMASVNKAGTISRSVSMSSSRRGLRSSGGSSRDGSSRDAQKPGASFRKKGSKRLLRKKSGTSQEGDAGVSDDEGVGMTSFDVDNFLYLSDDEQTTDMRSDAKSDVKSDVGSERKEMEPEIEPMTKV